MAGSDLGIRTLVAVADGHRGFEASEVVLEHLLATPGPQWVEPGGVTPDSWARHALALNGFGDAA